MFKQSIRIQNPNIDPKDELEKMKEVDFFYFRSRLVDIETFSSSKRMKKNARTTKDYVNSKNMNVRHKN